MSDPWKAEVANAIPEDPDAAKAPPSSMPPFSVSFPDKWIPMLDALQKAMGVESKELAVARAIATLSQNGVVGEKVYVESARGEKKFLPLWKVQ